MIRELGSSALPGGQRYEGAQLRRAVRRSHRLRVNWLAANAHHELEERFIADELNVNRNFAADEFANRENIAREIRQNQIPRCSGGLTIFARESWDTAEPVRLVVSLREVE